MNKITTDEQLKQLQQELRNTQDPVRANEIVWLINDYNRKKRLKK